MLRLLLRMIQRLGGWGSWDSGKGGSSEKSRGRENMWR